ncbi:hypothetical protein N0V93_006825 [Gnomoniopsis smithogilvyi]|uniref:Major facilitator superfamily (MFS) profile domain-containing protein n=1 Tax=Gnomoniopsis smithogilvyi TaxID=1191159 RepID=A0A9W9CUU1_9PEZI|nr:hypothetical protein N0V93_006825 [Gnomoniopsis smithogilvyi]
MGKLLARFLSRIVRNDAMKKDFGGMLFGWDIGAISGILTYGQFMTDYHYDATVETLLSENIVSTLQAGCFFASLISSLIADRFGRKWPLVGAGVMTCAGVALQAGSRGSLIFMYIGRLVAGFGVGAASMLTPLYVSECAPRAIRGGLTGFYQLFIVTGTMISFWINFGIRTIQGTAIYQVPLSLQAVPALTLALAMMLCPESLRSDHEYIRGELQDMAEQLDMERRLVGEATWWTLFKEMWMIRGNRNRALISIGLMNYYAPQIFADMGLTEQAAALFATGVYGLVKMLSSMCFLLFAADSLGRRKSLLISSVGMAVTLYLVGVYEKLYSGQKTGIPPMGYVAIVCIYLYVFFFQFGWGPCCWIYVSEIPTARLRTLNVGMAAATQWLINFVIARTTLTMITSLNYGTWMLFGTFCAVTFFFVFFLIPETKGMSLEKMDDLFGITDDLLRMMDENQRERAAMRSAASELETLVVPGRSYMATTMAGSNGNLDKQHTGPSRSINEPVYQL